MRGIRGRVVDQLIDLCRVAFRPQARLLGREVVEPDEIHAHLDRMQIDWRREPNGGPRVQAEAVQPVEFPDLSARTGLVAAGRERGIHLQPCLLRGVGHRQSIGWERPDQRIPYVKHCADARRGEDRCRDKEANEGSQTT